MNSLLKKYLFYNLLGLVLLAIATTVLIVVLNNYQLNTNWCLWYHNINDTNWKNNSYKNIYNIKNAYDLKFLNDTIQKIHLQNGMFFIMRDNIFPTWEDPDNRLGGCISYKIPSDNILGIYLCLYPSG